MWSVFFKGFHFIYTTCPSINEVMLLLPKNRDSLFWGWLDKHHP